jgi:hypothetical protein
MAWGAVPSLRSRGQNRELGRLIARKAVPSCNPWRSPRAGTSEAKTRVGAGLPHGPGDEALVATSLGFLTPLQEASARDRLPDAIVQSIPAARCFARIEAGSKGLQCLHLRIASN